MFKIEKIVEIMERIHCSHKTIEYINGLSHENEIDINQLNGTGRNKYQAWLQLRYKA